MNEAMTFMQDLLKQVINLKGQMLVMVSCLGVGYALRLVPKFQNKWIPLAVMIFGAGLNPCIVGRGNVDPDVNNPVAHLVLQGFVIGILAWIAHNKFLVKYLDPKMEDTMFFKKDK